MVIGFYAGSYLYKINQIQKNNKQLEIAEKIEDECTAISELNSKEELISANSKEQKTSPNCAIIFKIYYQKCGHLIEKKEEIKTSEVNLTEEELKSKFKDWQIQKFTSSEIILYKEIDDFCNEHYVLREKNGNIAVFNVNQNNKEELIQITDISIEYLEEEDLEKLKSGIYINSKKELNKTLEDFE